MRPEVKLFQRIHAAGGCDTAEEYSKGWDDAIALCERIATEVLGVGYDDVVECDDAEPTPPVDVVQDDPVNHPAYYCDGIETLDFILAKKMDFLLGQVCKYITRAGKKDPSKEVEDLQKARFYLDRKIRELEKVGR